MSRAWRNDPKVHEAREALRDAVADFADTKAAEASGDDGSEGMASDAASVCYVKSVDALCEAVAACSPGVGTSLTAGEDEATAQRICDWMAERGVDVQTALNLRDRLCIEFAVRRASQGVGTTAVSEAMVEAPKWERHDYDAAEASYDYRVERYRAGLPEVLRTDGGAHREGLYAVWKLGYRAALSAPPAPTAEQAEPTHKRLLKAINKACGIIETGDQRLLAGDGPAGGQPPELSLAEWRTLYVTLDNARNAK